MVANKQGAKGGRAVPMALSEYHLFLLYENLAMGYVIGNVFWFCINVFLKFDAFSSVTF